MSIYASNLMITWNLRWYTSRL